MAGALGEAPRPAVEGGFGSRWYSATAKKQTIETLRKMLGTAWRFMVVRWGWCDHRVLSRNAALSRSDANLGHLSPHVEFLDAPFADGPAILTGQNGGKEPKKWPEGTLVAWPSQDFVRTPRRSAG